MVSALVCAHSDVSQDFRFRVMIPVLLLEQAPQPLDRLSRTEDAQTQEIAWGCPDDLLGSWGRPDPDKTEKLAAQLSPQEMLDALRGEDVPRSIAACCLALPLSQRIAWVEVAQILVENIARTEVYVLQPSRDSPRTKSAKKRSIERGSFAAERLLKVLRQQFFAEDPQALFWLYRGLVAVLQRRAPLQREGGELRRSFLNTQSFIRARSKSLYRDALHQIAATKPTDPTERFALLLLDDEPEVKQRAVALLCDPEEDIVLRALIGGQLHTWNMLPDALSEWLDTSASPWTLLQESRASLPIAEPGKDVPLSWLVASLEAIGGERGSAPRGALRHLGNRLGAGRTWDAEPSWKTRAQACCSEPIRQQIRAVLSIEKTRDAPRWPAAVCLALLGCEEDQERLANFVALFGPWTRLDPRGDEIAAVPLSEHLLLSPFGAYSAHHLLEPCLYVGFGTERTQRLMARAFVIMGRNAFQDGALQQAIRACKRARTFDPFNLSARRALQNLHTLRQEH